eukprot:TRINITY_DN13474_c0_g1_i1.p1 TRINITY_DN13474_c0_g1~~TRINITY_DN13474_c0_g1_i1.p1  ORF type:complete len:234 (+),score=54.48 TRINITY_DN13474_c0_g1_i1:235-936(+)
MSKKRCAHTQLCFRNDLAIRKRPLSSANSTSAQKRNRSAAWKGNQISAFFQGLSIHHPALSGSSQLEDAPTAMDEEPQNHTINATFVPLRGPAQSVRLELSKLLAAASTPEEQPTYNALVPQRRADFFLQLSARCLGLRSLWLPNPEPRTVWKTKIKPSQGGGAEVIVEQAYEKGVEEALPGLVLSEETGRFSHIEENERERKLLSRQMGRQLSNQLAMSELSLIASQMDLNH